MKFLSPPPRDIKLRYEDPMSLIWISCLESLGWSLLRSSEVFASWDGKSILTLGQAQELDQDDHLGQLILHELCHAILEGARGRCLVDWGLENIDQRHLVNELACHRLQAHLADQYELRDLFAVTTDWRPYFDQIPRCALEAQSEEAIAYWAEPFDLSLQRARALDTEAIRRVSVVFSTVTKGDQRDRLTTATLGEQRGSSDAQGVGQEDLLVAIHEALALSREISILLRRIAPQDTLWRGANYQDFGRQN